MADGGQKINQIVQFDEKSHQKVSFTYLFKHYLEAKDYVRLIGKNRVILNIIYSILTKTWHIVHYTFWPNIESCLQAYTIMVTNHFIGSQYHCHDYGRINL